MCLKMKHGTNIQTHAMKRPRRKAQSLFASDLPVQMFLETPALPEASHRDFAHKLLSQNETLQHGCAGDFGDAGICQDQAGLRNSTPSLLCLAMSVCLETSHCWRQPYQGILKAGRGLEHISDLVAHQTAIGNAIAAIGPLQHDCFHRLPPMAPPFLVGFAPKKEV